MWLISKVQKVHSNYENSNRNISLDILKGIAIFCVVWGHFIQQGTLSAINFQENPVFQLIYSFHMPLFMLISGYLMYQSINKRTLLQQWIHWGKTLVLPLLSWTIIANLFILICHYVKFGSIIGFTINIMQYWFIISLLACGILATILKKLFNNRTSVFLLILLIIFITGINSFSMGWMFPFFVGGYIAGKYSHKITQNPHLITVICLILYPILLMFYTPTTLWYSSFISISDIILGSPINITIENWFTSISINAYKILTGFAGCGFMYCVVKLLLKINAPSITAILAWLGTHSLTIYFVQRVIIEILFGKYLYSSNILVYDFVFTFGLAIIATIFFAFIGECIKKNTTLNTILCGGR